MAMKKADIWGKCPKRKLQYCGRHGWRYICENTRGYCHPNYCLGPDELEEERSNNED